METVRVQIDSDLLSKIDKVAQATRRSRDSLIAEALENYIAAQQWQVDEILKAVQEANRGDFASDADVNRTIKKWTGKSQ